MADNRATAKLTPLRRSTTDRLPEQARPDQEHPDQQHSDQERPDQEHSDQERPDQQHSDQERPDQQHADQERPDGLRAADQPLAADTRPHTQAPPSGLMLPAAPLTGGPLAFLKFARSHGMLKPRYLPLVARWLWLKLRWRGRLTTDGLCFIRPGARFEIGRQASVSLGRWSWIGDGTKIRAHEGRVTIGERTVLGQECTLSSFQCIDIGRDCIIADRVMMIDFDHRTDDVEQPIRKQGIYKRDVHVGNNVWIGHGACLLRGITVGDNAIIGANAVVTTTVPANAVAGGAPARVLRMRQTPQRLRYL
ncbi:MAG: DapH/DapD/GlmU-related protein [Solirubrobacteraceae bacterium]